MKLQNGMYVQCETEEQAKEFIKEAYKQGFKWVHDAKGNSGELLFWHYYKGNTYYHLLNSHITYGDVNICPEVLNEKGWKDKVIKFTDLEV